MIKESITVDEVLEVLNGAIEMDRSAIARLIDARVPCNETLANHPTIQVAARPEQKNKFEVGFLGTLNGLFGISDESGFGIISAVYDVNCPNSHIVEKGQTVHDTCNECDSQLILGKLVKFERTAQKYLDGSYKEENK